MVTGLMLSPRFLPISSYIIHIGSRKIKKKKNPQEKIVIATVYWALLYTIKSKYIISLNLFTLKSKY